MVNLLVPPVNQASTTIGKQAGKNQPGIQIVAVVLTFTQVARNIKKRRLKLSMGPTVRA